MNEKIIQKALDNTAEEFNENSEGVGKELAEAGLYGAKTVKLVCKGAFVTAETTFNGVASIVSGGQAIKEKFFPKVDKKIAAIPEENRIIPSTRIAAPIYNEVRFSIEEPELQNMFANLLATAMDKETESNAHPSFVGIIQQLSPDEARILNYMKNVASVPLIDVKEIIWLMVGDKEPNIFLKQNHEEGVSNFNKITTNFSLLGDDANCLYPDSTQTYIDNLCRLRLCEIPNGEFLSDSNKYHELKVTFLLRNASIRQNDLRLRYVNKMLTLTNFGKQFIEACIKNKDEPELQQDPETSSG